MLPLLRACRPVLPRGVEFGARMVNIDGKQIKLQIWDTVRGRLGWAAARPGPAAKAPLFLRTVCSIWGKTCGYRGA